MQAPPVILEDIPDVSVVNATREPLEIWCDGLLAFTGTFTGGMDVSFNMGLNFFRLRDGSVFPVLKDQRYSLRQRSVSAGDMQIAVWPSTDVPGDMAGVAILAAASGGTAEQGFNERVPVEETGTSTADAADTITISGITGTQIFITGMYVFIEAAACATEILVELEDGTTPIWQGVIGLGAPRGTPVGAEGGPWPITAGVDANLRISAGGTAVVTRSSLVGFRVNT